MRNEKFRQLQVELGCTEEAFDSFLDKVEWDDSAGLDEKGYLRLVNLWHTSGADDYFASKNPVPRRIDLRTCDYRTYLSSDHWARVRDAALRPPESHRRNHITRIAARTGRA